MSHIYAITGGGSGLGRATAHVMGERGHRIILTGRTPTRLEGRDVRFASRAGSGQAR